MKHHLKKSANRNLILLLMAMAVLTSCHTINNPETEKGLFGYDLQFLRKHVNPIVLKRDDGLGQIIVSPEYQGKVFTSTAEGNEGKSFGWINYDLIASGEQLEHMNGYGGEDRLWLGPEGGQFSIFFKPGAPRNVNNWYTPAAIDTEKWKLVEQTEKSVQMAKDMNLGNASGSSFSLKLERSVKLIERNEVEEYLGIKIPESLAWVAYESENQLTNTGEAAWNKESGTLCLWVLGMFNTSPNTSVIIPFIPGEEDSLGKIATTNYFGEIPQDRIIYKDSTLFFKVDGNHRSKLGLSLQRAKTYAGSYDEDSKTLTIIQYSKPSGNAEYINQLWPDQEEPFKGDILNSYNDGILEDGSQMGPFYELESSSPAAFLNPDKHISHVHRTFHFTGDEQKLSELTQKLFGWSVDDIKDIF